MGRAAVSAMIVPINSQAGGNESLNQPLVSANVFTHAMGDLDDAACRPFALPSGAGHAQAVCTGKPKPGGRNRRGLEVVNCHAISGEIVFHFSLTCLNHRGTLRSSERGRVQYAAYW